jgi:hypothetical protein
MKNPKSGKRRLSICPLEIYDSTLGVWPQIGVKSSYSDTLLRNLSASVIADASGLASVDYVKKRYLNDWERHVDLSPNAFDIKTIHFLDVCILELQKHVIANSHNLCRSSLEMIMWAFTVFDLPDEQDPFEFFPERAVSGFKVYLPYAGKYYGYLSAFSHWRKETHARVFDFEEDYTAVVYASGRNKWEAMANVMLMAHVYAECYMAKYPSLKCKPGRKQCLSEIREVSEKIDKRQ